MTFALPLPYEDELLCNNIGRYMELLAVDKPTNAIRALFGRLVFPSADLMCGLGELARQTYDSWGLSSKEIADLYTPLPYYASYATDHARAAAYQAIVGDGETKASLFLGHGKCRVVGPSKFRFCVQCAREDIANYGETYWRRSFQLPGVVVCPTHRLSLRESGAHTRPRSATEWHAGNVPITTLLEDDSTQNTLWNGNPHVLEVARRSIELLACDATKSVPTLSEHYLSLAHAAGLTRPSGIIDGEVLSREIRAMYGEDFLNATRLSVSAVQRLEWPKDMLVRTRASFQPLQHILLGYFLEHCATSVMESGQAQLTARQNFVCPNRYATHGAGHVIERVKVTQTTAGRVGNGYCSCGLKFSFQRCRVGTTEPEILKVIDYGKDWREAARAMRQIGTPFSTIAREMGVSINAATLMVTRKHAREVAVTETHILEWRREWGLLLESVAPLGHQAARELNVSLYERLNKYDATWFRACGRRHRRKPSPAQRRHMVDWVARDKVWSEALRTAAAKLYSSESRSRRVSVAAIIAEADVHEFTRRTIDRLPLCRAALAELAESIEHFTIHRLERAAQYFLDRGESPTTSRLLRRASIKTQMTPLIQATIDRVVDESGAWPLQMCQED